jgi:hypothetical protein
MLFLQQKIPPAVRAIKNNAFFANHYFFFMIRDLNGNKSLLVTEK